ncbi:hypothetical protein GIB67_017083 [Kingdonia uniflora]|uniref:Uncharacterized protein n=1 Tax=Kingdonia uniflora TaxID=39325 RepID=A0A7J7NCZ8_9MAGN|nr:hypothetical protein GIB67_017083 [Kingdonia uniflora]
MMEYWAMMANFLGVLAWITILAHLTILAYFLLANFSTKSTGLMGSSFRSVGVGFGSVGVRWAGGLSSFFSV